ncbi:MAG: ABC transporter ATP-binding protein/permease [Thermoanaerobaculia bacterium]|nr:ABC transporter ATP-binding protein/permease [Thermoanaerobaculia bacterium]
MLRSEQKSAGTGTEASFRSLWRLIRIGEPPAALLAFALFLALLEIGGSLWFPILTRDLVDQLGAEAFRAATVWLLAAVLVAASIVGALARFLLSKVGLRLTAKLQSRLLSRVLRQKMTFYDQRTTGELVSRVTSDSDSVSDLIATQVANFVSGVLLLVGSAVVLWFLDVQLTLVLVSMIVAAFVFSLPVLLKLESIGRDQQDKLASFSSLLTQVLSEVRLIKAYSAEEREIGRGRHEIEGLRDVGLRAARIQVALEPIMGLSITLALIAILGYGGIRVARGDLSVGTLTAFILYIFNVVTPLVQLSAFFSAYQTAKGATERIREILDLDEEDLTQGLVAMSPGQSIHFDDVTFAYSVDREPVLHGVGMTFEAGSTTAIVGASGSGKSTVLALLERFYEPTDGQIRYGDVPIRDLALGRWRSLLGFVSQSAPVLRGTLRDNLCYGMDDDADEGAVMSAVRAAELADFVEALPDGLQTLISEVGSNVSGGQRQRIAIARVLLRNPAVLMLDEATSSLDSETEARVQKALDTVMEGRTNIVVAHRLSTVQHADRIYVLESGEVTGVGTHEELLSSHSYYARLVERQFLAKE